MLRDTYSLSHLRQKPRQLLFLLTLGVVTSLFLMQQAGLLTYSNVYLYIFAALSPFVFFCYQSKSFCEITVRAILFGSASFSILLTFTIGLILIVESARFFNEVSFLHFITGLTWNPTNAQFGVVPLLLGTLIITGIAMLIAIPVGLMSAIYLSCYAHENTRSIVKPMMEMLAGVPTVVYGFVAIVAVAPFIHKLGVWIGVSIDAESALAVGVVMGIMILPYIASLSDDVISSIPHALRDGSLALGATESEGIKHIIVPAAMPGILASILLALSRAIGETMIVVMAAGYSARLTANPLETVTTVTVQIVSLLTGDQAFNSPKTLAAFGLGLTLFVITLIINMMALKIVRYYRDKYE